MPSKPTTAPSSMSRTRASALARSSSSQKLKRGEPVDPKLIGIRTVPKFETGAEKYRWLMEHIFIGSAARHADRVVIDVHQVM